jgi:hypothetical protein
MLKMTNVKSMLSLKLSTELMKSMDLNLLIKTAVGLIIPNNLKQLYVNKELSDVKLIKNNNLKTLSIIVMKALNKIKTN